MAGANRRGERHASPAPIIQITREPLDDASIRGLVSAVT